MRRFRDISKEMRRSQFKTLGVGSGKVVMLGDSITEQGMWGEWFPNTPIINRGVSGDTSAEVLARLDTAINAPSAVFLLIGTNDLGALAPLANIVNNVRAILAELDCREPGKPVFVQSIMPRSVDYLSDIQSLNAAYQDLVAATRLHVTYIDLWPALATSDGTLRPELLGDNLHLNGRGYAAWVEVLRPHIARVTQGA